MKVIGIIVLSFFILWLFFHKKKDKENFEYDYTIASGFKMLPTFTKYYMGVY